MRQGFTVKLGFKEQLNKKQIGNSEPFPVTNLQVYLINSEQIGIISVWRAAAPTLLRHSKTTTQSKVRVKPGYQPVLPTAPLANNSFELLRVKIINRPPARLGGRSP